MTRARTIAAAVLLGGALLASGALPAHASAPPRRAVVGDYFTKQDIERSRRYRAPRYALAFIAIGAEIIALLAVGLASGTRRLGALASSIGGGRWWLQAIVIALGVTIVLALVDLPFGLGRNALDRAWGLSTQGTAGYLADTLRGFAFNSGVTIVAALALIGIARALPRGWPFVAAGAAVVLTVTLSLLWPVIYEPLFNRFTPVEPALRDRIVALGRAEGVRVGAVLVADASRRTTTQNAYVSGLGGTKRVVLYDTLLQKSSPKEIELVVAHELAHVAHHDVAKGTAVGALGAAAGVALIWLLLAWPGLRSYLGVTGAGDPRVIGFVALVFTVAGLLVMPVGNAYSRSIEAAADRTAIEVTRDPGTDIDVEIALARDGIADLAPNPFVRWAFFTHPPTLERIQLALDYAAEHGIELPPR